MSNSLFPLSPPSADHSSLPSTLLPPSPPSLSRLSSTSNLGKVRPLPVVPSSQELSSSNQTASSSGSTGEDFKLTKALGMIWSKRSEFADGFFEVGGKVAGGLFRTLTGSERNPAMENLLEKQDQILKCLNLQNESVREFSRFFTEYARTTFNENREKNKTKLIQFFQEKIGQKTIVQFIGTMFDHDANLLEETMVVNILNLITNLANTAYHSPETRLAFSDGQRNFLGKFITLFSLYDCETELHEIALPETTLVHRKQLFHGIAGKLLLKAFPNGVQDIILFHDGIPVDAVKKAVCPILHDTLAELIESMHNDNLSFDSRWQGRFNAVMAIPEAHHLATTPSALIKTLVIEDTGRGLTEMLTPKLDRWLKKHQMTPLEVHRNRLITTILELFLTQSHKLKEIGSFFERILMERALIRFADVPPDVGPLLPYKIRQLVPLLSDLISVFRTQDGTNKDLKNHPNQDLYDSMIQQLLLCLGWDRQLPFPERVLGQLGLEPKLRNLISTKARGFFVDLNWPAMRNEQQNLDYLHREISDRRMFSPFIDLVPNLIDTVFNKVKDESNLQSILQALPTVLTQEQIEALTTQWIELFADEAFASIIKERASECIRALIVQIFTDIHKKYIQEATPSQMAEGQEPPPRLPFDQWLVEKVAAVFNQVTTDQFSGDDVRRLRRYIELQSLLKSELGLDERRLRTRELKLLLPQVRAHFERSAQALFSFFGYEQANQLPIPFGQEALWKIIPDLFLQYGSRLLIPVFNLQNNHNTIQQTANFAAFNGISAFVPKLAELIVHKATEWSTIEQFLRTLPTPFSQDDIDALHQSWNRLLVNPEDPNQPRPLIPVHVRRLIETLVQPIVVQCFADINRTYIRETEPRPAAEGEAPRPRKVFDIWFVEKMFAAVNGVNVSEFNLEERAALIRTNQLQRLLKTQALTEQLRQQYVQELENTSNIIKPKFEQASQTLFRAFGYERASDIPLPYGQELLWDAIPKLLMEYGGPLLSHQFNLVNNRAMITQLVGDASPVNGANVISAALSGLLANFLTSPSLLTKLSGLLSTAANEEQINGFRIIWERFLSAPEATIHTNLEHGVDALLNPALTQLFADLRTTYQRETEGQQPPIDFTLWVVGKLTAVFNEITFERFPEDQRATLRQALSLKELVSVEQDSERKQQLEEELAQHWEVLKPYFVRAAAIFYSAFGYERAGQLPVPYGQQALWDYIPKLIFDHMSDPLVPFLEREECRAALRAHDFGEQQRGQPLGDIIVTGCQQLSQDVLRHLPEYINSYEIILTRLNNEGVLPHRLPQERISHLTTTVTQLVESRRLNSNTLFETFETSFNDQHPEYTPQQRMAVREVIRRYVKDIKRILITPEEMAEKLIALNSTPEVKRHLAQQMQVLINRTDGPSQPLKEFIGSYIEGMMLLAARQAITLFNQETLNAMMTLFQQTKAQLDQHPDQAEAFVETFIDQMFIRFGVGSALDIRGIPFSLNKKMLSGIKSTLKAKLLATYQIERQCQEILATTPQAFLPLVAVGGPQAGGNAQLPLGARLERVTDNFETAIYSVIRNSLQSAVEYLTSPVTPRAGEPAVAAPQLQGIEELYRSIRNALLQLTEEHYGVAATITTLLDNHTFTPHLRSFLTALNQGDLVGYQTIAAALVTPFITERARGVVENFTRREAVERSDYHQGILREMLDNFNTHLKTMNQASSMVGGLNFQNYRQAYERPNRQLHPGVPREVTNEFNRIDHFEQRQAGFFFPMLEDVLHLVFPGGLEEIKELVRRFAPELVGPIWESTRASVGETLSQQLERLFNNDLFLTLMNSVLESIIASLRRPIEFPQPIARPADQARRVQNAQPLQAVAGRSAAVNERNRPPVVVERSGSVEVPRELQRTLAIAIARNQVLAQAPRGWLLNDQVDTLIGECIREGVEFFDLPIIKSILSMSPWMKHLFRIDRLETNAYRSIGNAIREQFQNRPIHEGIQRAVAQLSQQHQARVAAAANVAIPPQGENRIAPDQPNRAVPAAQRVRPVRRQRNRAVRPAAVARSNSVQRQVVVPAVDRAVPLQNQQNLNRTAVVTPRERLTELKSELAKELVVYPFRYLAAFVRYHTTTRYRAVNVVTNTILAVISFVMTRMIGGAIKILKIDKFSQVCIENLIDNIENRLSLSLTNFQLNENFIYNEVEVFRRLIRRQNNG